METQKNMNLLNDLRNEQSKFARNNCYVIVSETAKDKYNQNNSIKRETEGIKSSLWDYFDALILVTNDTAINAGNDIDYAFKNCAPFSTCKKKINDVLIVEAKHLHFNVYVKFDWI